MPIAHISECMLERTIVLSKQCFDRLWNAALPCQRTIEEGEPTLRFMTRRRGEEGVSVVVLHGDPFAEEIIGFTET
jgi:hypothetical protein